MNGLPVTLRIILSVLIAWSLVSSCNSSDDVEDYIQPHEVEVFTSIDITVDTDQYLSEYGESFPDPVPENLIFRMRITGTYNNGGKSVLGAEELKCIQWTDASISDDINQVATKYEEHENNGQSYEDGEISLKIIGTEKQQTISVVALFLPCEDANGNRSFSSEAKSFQVIKPTLTSIRIEEIEDEDAKEYCNLTDDREGLANEIVGGCLKQFKAWGSFNNWREDDLTEYVAWKVQDGEETLTRFIKNIYDPADGAGDISADIDGTLNWPEKLDEYIESRGLKNKNGLALGKNQGKSKFQALYSSEQNEEKNYDIKDGTVTGEVSYEVIPAQMRAVTLELPEIKNEPPYPRYGDCEEEAENCKQVEYDEANDVRYMIENTYAYAKVTGIYENRAELSLTGSVDEWNKSPDTSDISIDSVTDKITANSQSDIITITARKDSASASIDLKVESEVLNGVSFEVERGIDSSDDKYTLYRGNAYYKDSNSARFYVTGTYNSDSRFVSSSKRHCRRLSLNHDADWVLSSVDPKVDVSGDGEEKELWLIKPDSPNSKVVSVERLESWETIEATCDINTDFPIWIDVTKLGDSTNDEVSFDGAITLKVEEIQGAGSDATTWYLLIDSGKAPVTVKITPSIDTSIERWLIADKLIKLEALAVYESGRTEILPHNYTAWCYYENDGYGYPDQDCTSDVTKTDWNVCDKDETDFKCIKDGSGILLMTRKKLYIKAQETDFNRSDVLDASPDSTKLQDIELYPKIKTANAGESVFFTAEGMFDNDKMYDLSDDCLVWSVEPSEKAVIDNGVFRSFPTIDNSTDIKITAKSRSSCSTGFDWIDIVGDISNDIDITVNPLPVVYFSSFKVNEIDGDVVYEADAIGSPVEIKLQLKSSAVYDHDIIVPYVVEGTASWGEDHDLTNGYLVIRAGETNSDTDIVFNVYDDELDESSFETIEIEILTEDLVHARVTSNDATVLKIKDNDLSPDVNFDGGPSVHVDESEGLVFITFELNTESELDITMDYKISGTAEESKDYVYWDSDYFTIEKGSKTAVMIFDISNDRDYEREETIIVDISADTVVNAEWGGPETYIFNIQDNDPLTISSESLASGGDDPSLDCANGAEFAFAFTVNTDITVDVSMTNAPIEWEDFEFSSREYDTVGDTDRYWTCSIPTDPTPDVYVYEGIFICVKDSIGEEDCLPPFDLKVTK